MTGVVADRFLYWGGKTGISLSPEEAVARLQREGFDIIHNSSYQNLTLSKIYDVNQRPVEIFAEIRGNKNQELKNPRYCSGTLSAFLNKDPVKYSELSDALSFIDEWSGDLSERMGLYVNNPIQNLLRRGFRLGVSYDLQDPLDTERDVASLIERVHSQGHEFATSFSPERDAEILASIENGGMLRSKV